MSLYVSNKAWEMPETLNTKITGYTEEQNLLIQIHVWLWMVTSGYCFQPFQEKLPELIEQL